jgi:hypothetical protein
MSKPPFRTVFDKVTLTKAARAMWVNLFKHATSSFPTFLDYYPRVV